MQAQTLTIAVLSGKGGVGKTNITLNTALALNDMGYRVLVMDGDLGLANIDVLLGITPTGNLQNCLRDATDPLDAVCPVCEGLDVLPAASGEEDIVTLCPDMAQGLRDTLAPVVADYDFVLIDLGAGLSANVRLMASMAYARLVVTTPEPTAITDAYALIKVLNKSHGLSSFHVVVNNVYEESEEQACMEKLFGACSHFLGFKPTGMGSVRFDPSVSEAVCAQRPLLEYLPDSDAAEDIRALAGEIARMREKLLEKNKSFAPFLPVPPPEGAENDEVREEEKEKKGFLKSLFGTSRQ